MRHSKVSFLKQHDILGARKIPAVKSDSSAMTQAMRRSRRIMAHTTIIVVYFSHDGSQTQVGFHLVFQGDLPDTTGEWVHELRLRSIGLLLASESGSRRRECCSPEGPCPTPLEP